MLSATVFLENSLQDVHPFNTTSWWHGKHVKLNHSNLIYPIMYLNGTHLPLFTTPIV